MKIVRKLLTPDEISNPNVRWNPGTDAIETTHDGGTTWTPNPASDPRYSPAFQAPPIVSDNPVCDASARMTASLQGVLNTFLVDIALATAATTTLTYLLLLTGPVGWLFDLIIAASDVLIAIGATAISTAFTGDVWAGIQQIIFCAMEADGTLTQADTVDILAQIDALYPGTVADTVHKLIQLYGNVLLNNAAYERTETGSCDDFACTWCYEWSGDSEFTAEGMGHEENTAASQFWDFDTPAGFALTLARFDWTCDTGIAGDSGAAIWAALGFTDRLILLAPLGATSGTLEWTGTHIASGLSFGLNASAGSGGTVGLSNLHLEGTGARPAWTHGTDCS